MEYADRQDYESKYRAKQRAERNEIGPLPTVKDPERRARTKNDFVAFCKEYFPDVFFREWQGFHYEVAKEFERVVLNGGKKALAAPRGTCKSTFARAAILWAMFQHPEKHKVVLYLGAIGGATERTHKQIYSQIFSNTILGEDFPEICYPYRKQNRNKHFNPTVNGEPCMLRWVEDEIVLPTIAASETSGSTIKFYSIGSSGLRGLDVTIGNVAIRPTLVVIDDPQSDDSAKSAVQVSSMHGVITGTVANLSGFDRSTKRRSTISVIAVCTCIAENDLAMQLLDRERSPDYQGSLYQRFVNKQLPVNMDLWKQYKEIRTKSIGEHGDIRDATAFYSANRAVMDEGAVPLDDDDCEMGMLSGIQFGMDRWAESEVTFWTEQMNSPADAKYADGTNLTVPMVLDKSIPLKRGWVPKGTEVLTAHIDVGKHYLNWEIDAFGPDFTFSHTVDFGVFPEQYVPKITKKTPSVDLQEKYTEGDEYDRVKSALVDCMKHIVNKAYFDHEGNPIGIREGIGRTQHATKQEFPFLAMIGVDASDGEREGTVWQAIAEFHRYRDGAYANRAIPMYGTAPASRLMRYYDLKEGEWRRGALGAGDCDWIENYAKKQSYLSETRGLVPACLVYDANTYKTERNSAWLCRTGRPGAHTIFDDTIENLTMYAEHQCAEEIRRRRKMNGLEVNLWEMKKPHFSDNEFFDTNTGCRVLASYVGIEIQSKTNAKRPIARRKWTKEEYQAIINRR